MVEPEELRDRVWTIPNILSFLRLASVPVFLYLLLVAHADAPAAGVLMFSGVSDWADGKIARLVDNQASRLGVILDPLADRIFTIVIPIAFALRDFVPWWVVATMLGRDAVLALMLPALRRRGMAALPATYIGKAATFCLLSAFPLILLGQFDPQWSHVVRAVGFGFLGWGVSMYVWSLGQYLVQFRMVLRTMPELGAGAPR
ncbi:CDP-alcohol phosphatidyltransferase family protein [Mycobacterium sp. MYCO198283]|uniref:CDP-alcohol phosphatidyltransferase family protein n=1 Tax=Mycobacterium sp. MYCO198283 TaxID=2883505 RepID=UPI001E6439B2|nr:CDP-alcohol phosphatidyltransferase family protein [Mycobacterium sp. MYCO198283]MCG5433181.1 CDP-alcohol phosphatidyltransferase family protein [Mycobacterium sp. MYCO198283]